MADTLQVVAHLVPKPGKESDLRAIMKSIVLPTRDVDGCIQFEIHENRERPAEITTIEEWTGDPAYASLFVTPHIRKALERAEEILGEHMDVRRLDRISTKSGRSPLETAVPNPFRVVAAMQARGGKEAELESVLKKLIEPTRAEEGCVRYDLHVNKEKPGEFVFIEEWDDEDALVAHFETPHLLGALARFDELVEGELDLRKLTQIG